MTSERLKAYKEHLARLRRDYLAYLGEVHALYAKEPERHWFQSFLESQCLKPFAGPTGKLRIHQQEHDVDGVNLVGRMARWATSLHGPDMDPLEAHIRTVESLRFVEIDGGDIEWPDITYHLKE